MASPTISCLQSTRLSLEHGSPGFRTRVRTLAEGTNGSYPGTPVSLPGMLLSSGRIIKTDCIGRGYGPEAIVARRLMCHMLHALAISGWHLAFSTDLCKKSWDKDTLYFKPGPPRQRYFFSVSFNEFDKIRLIDSPNPDVTTAFQAAVSVSALCSISG